MSSAIFRHTLGILLLLFPSTITYSNKFAHEATLDEVPANKDDTAVLQCYTYGSDPFPWPHLADNVQKTTNYTTVWMKDDKVIVPSGRVEISYNITYNFCNIFGSSGRFYTFTTWGKKVEGGAIQGYDIYRGFACFVSTLTIKEVKDSDYGTYHCNYSDFSPKPFKKFNHLAKVSLVRNSTDFVWKPTVKLLQQNLVWNDSIEYSYRRKEYERNRLGQCVSTGVLPAWYYVIGESLVNFPDCYASDKTCKLEKYSKKVDTLKSDDFYRCFKIQHNTWMPINSAVYESFLYFNNSCTLDDITFFCGSDDGKIADINNTLVLINPGDNSERYYHYSVDDAMRIAAGVGIFLVGSLLIAAAIVACSRITCPRRTQSSI